MAIFLLKGAGGGENLRYISLEIWHQKHINDKDLEGTNKLKFKLSYKYGISLHILTLFFLRICLEFLSFGLHREKFCMSNKDWEKIKEQIWQLGFTNLTDWKCILLIERMTTTHLEMELAQPVPIGLPAIAPRLPKPKPSASMMRDQN